MPRVIELADKIAYELENNLTDFPNDVALMLSRTEGALRKLYHNMEVINKWATEADKNSEVSPAAIAVIGVMSDLGQFTKEKGSDAGNS